MKNLTTPKAIFFGFLLIALSITTLPYSQKFISPAHAQLDRRDLKPMESKLTRISDAIRGIRACRG